jgi:hypothetical protein
MIFRKNIPPGIVLALLLNVCLSAQNSTDMRISLTNDVKQFLHEKALLFTDREIYSCGEKILLNAITYDADSFLKISVSTVLYAELYDTENKVIARGKYIISSGQASGFLSIPRTINSGVFYLRAYTNYMRNFGEQNFAVCRLKIINPLVRGSYLPVESGVVYSEPFEKLKIFLSSDSSVYRPGEFVRINIKATDNQGYAVKTNVVLTAAISIDNEEDVIPGYQGVKVSPGDYSQNYAYRKFIPEMKGDIITGKAVYRDGEPAAGIRVLQSFVGTASCVESCITGSDGSFRFVTANEKNRGDLILKADANGREVNLITDDEFSSQFPQQPVEKLELTSKEIELVKKMFINVQVADAFRFRDSVRVGKNEPGNPFYGDDYDEYDFSNYLRLPNMKEFAFEIILGVTVSKASKKDVIHITDKRSFRDIGPSPLLLIDGVPLTNHSIALSIDPEKVRLVRVVRDKYFYKDQVFDGILDIITKQGDAKSFTLPEGTLRQQFIHAENTPAAIIHPVPGNGDKIPDYRNLIYYNNGITTDDQGSASVSFKTPDNTGTFRIRCFVMSPDGKAGVGTCEIKIR